MPPFRTTVTQAISDIAARLGRHASFGVRWEDDLAYYLQGRPLRVAIDVGAHHGETARRLVNRFPGASVHCFEPIPASFRRLEQAVANLGVVCVPAALGDHAGTVQMGLGRSSFTSGFGATGPAVGVTVQTLDAYVASTAIDTVGLLKIDVEGHEPSVLRGATQLLEASRIEYILCECEFHRRPEEPHGDFDEIMKILSPHGFRIVSFYTGGVDGLGWRWGDVLFCGPQLRTLHPVACSPRERAALSGRAAR